MKINVLSKKVLLAVMVLTISVASMPWTRASASGLADDTNPPQVDNTRLEAAWSRMLTIHDRMTTQLDHADEMISRVQDLINKANEKNWDTSAVQAALDAFQDGIQDARPILNSANGIVTSHKGFDNSGKVTDRDQAVETIKELGQHLKDARTAMGGTGQTLREAIKAFREAHRPATTNP